MEESHVKQTTISKVYKELEDVYWGFATELVLFVFLF